MPLRDHRKTPPVHLRTSLVVSDMSYAWGVGFRQPVFTFTACGHILMIRRTTRDPSEITCNLCKRTRAYKALEAAKESE